MSLVRLFTEDRNRAFFMLREMLDQPGKIGTMVSHSVRPWQRLLVEHTLDKKRNPKRRRKRRRSPPRRE